MAEMGYGVESHDQLKDATMGEYPFKRADTALHVCFMESNLLKQTHLFVL